MPPSLVQFAEQILEDAKKLERSLSAPPTFLHDTISELPVDLQETRRSVIDATANLNALVRGSGGPIGRIFEMAYCYSDQLAMQAVYHFRIPHAVPLDGDISFKHLADQCSVDEQQMTRLIQRAMTFHVFHEPRPGYVAHTADSRLLVEDSTLYDLTGTLLEDLRPASLKITDAMEKWPSSQEANQTGWQLAYDTDEEMYNHLAKDPERLRRFGQHLVHIARQDPRVVEQIASAYPWSDVQNGKVVDLGGGNGQHSIGVAQRHHSLSFVVQDKPGVSETGQSSLSPELKERVFFMDHDMFEVQPIKDADIYFIRH
ncbi:hypothetical protein LTS18_012215, partial [Coniosporium uncinatum]